MYLSIVFILIAAVAIAGCSGYQQSQGPRVTGPAPPLSEGNVTVIIQNFAFNPSEVAVTKGTTVVWINRDSVDHQVTSDAGEIFRSNNIPDGAEYSYTFETGGIYPYHCALHPSMKGTITVT